MDRRQLIFQLVLAWILIGKIGMSQVGNPIINNYHTINGFASNQVWGIVQDKSGTLCLATNKGISRFDGLNWSMIPVPLNSSVRSIAISDKGRIFVGASREFGFLKEEVNGQLVYASLSDSLKEKEFSAVLNTFVVADTTYFMANHEKVFCFFDDLVQEVNLRHISYYRSFIVGDQVWLLDPSFGVAKLIGDQIEFIDTNPVPPDIYFLIPFDQDRLLAGTLKEGLFLYDKSKKLWARFKTDNDPLLKSSNPYTAIWLTNGKLAIASLKNGVFILNNRGSIETIYDKDRGLLNNSTYSLYQDSYNDLWIGQEKGVSHIELSVPFTKIGENSGIEGTVQTIGYYFGHLFCGTSNGIYHLPIEKAEKFYNHHFKLLHPDYIYNLDYCKVEIPGAPEPILLASCLRDLVSIDKNLNLNSIYKIYGCYSICPSPLKKGRVFLGSASGAQVLDIQYVNNQLKVIKVMVFPDFKESVRKILATPEGDFWIRTAFNEIYKIEFDNPDGIVNYSIHKFTKLNQEQPGLVITGLYLFSKKITIATNQGIFSTLLEEGKNLEKNFVRDTSFGISYLTDSLPVQALAQDPLGNFWMTSPNGLLSYEVASNWLNAGSFSRLNNYQIQNIISIDPFGVSFLTEDEIYFIHEHEKNKTQPTIVTYVSRIKIGESFKTRHFYQPDRDQRHLNEVIPYNQNTISFQFATPFYQNPESIKWSYLLEGYENGWKTTDKPQVDYFNLPSGKYTFKVKAHPIYGNENPPDSYSFTVQTPWYKKTFFIIVFVILGSLLLWLIITIYTLKLKREKKKLQEIIKEAIRKEEEQYEEIESQSDKLIQVNKELEKLSIVASKTDNAVTILNAHGKVEWINDGYIRMYGFTLEEIKLKNDFLIGENATVSINDMVDVWYGRRMPIVFENLKRTKSGQKIWAQTTLTPLLDQNKELYQLIAIDTDITKLKLAEAEIAAQKIEIESQRDLAVSQRDEIIQQKMEIIDSINYANRIQKAILLDEKGLHTVVKNTFVLFLPRDIVSGDFFWAHDNGHQKIIATVDCTGHGVPGAFLSLIGISFLNNIVKEKSVLQPYEILNLLRDQVIKSLGQTGKEGESKDGMDISICLIDEKEHSVTFAGANSPAYLFSQTGVIELEANKMPISLYMQEFNSFTQHKYFYQSGDILYMFTDGFADQFGGPMGKKYMTKTLKKFFREIFDKELSVQKELLYKEHLDWKGVLNQIDDILIVGIKFD